MNLKTEHTIEVSSLKLLPYPILIIAIIDVIMLAKFDAGSTYITYMVFSTLSILAYAAEVHCLSGLINLSERIKTAMILMVMASVSACAIIAVSAVRLYLIACGNESAVIILELIIQILFFIREISFAMALLCVAKAVGASIETDGHAGAYRTGRLLEKAAAAYFLLIAILAIWSVLARMIATGFIVPLLTAILTVCTIVDIILFLLLKKAAAFIWQRYSISGDCSE